MQTCLFIFMYLNKPKYFYGYLIALCIFCSVDTFASIAEPFRTLEPDVSIQSTLIRLHHADAETIVKMLEKRQSGEGLLSKEGHVTVDKTTNALWISDTKARLNTIRQFIHHIDLPVKQIMLQAYLVNADQNFTQDMGIDFSEGQRLPEPAILGIRRVIPQVALQKNKLHIAVTNLGPVSLEMALIALENQGRGRILSSPRLITSNGKTAYIGSGDEIPYQEKTSHGNTSVAFKKAVLSLEVTPQLLPGKKMVLDLLVHQDKVSSLVIHGVPAIHTQEVRTQVRVGDQQTVILGGIFEYVRTEQFVRIPGLGHLPLIGKLFQHKVSKRERRELLIFITPRIVTS